MNLHSPPKLGLSLLFQVRHHCVIATNNDRTALLQAMRVMKGSCGSFALCSSALSSTRYLYMIGNDASD